jgi:hypothetical protein
MGNFTMMKSTRSKILATAATAVALAHSGAAQAAVAGVTTTTPTPTTFNSVVVGSIVSGDGAAQTNTGNVNAGVTSSTITTTVSGASTGSFINSTNTADALAQGNVNNVTVSLATISSATSDGIAIATVSDNTGAIKATATNQDAGANLTGFTSGSVAVASNSIDATTAINSGTTTINNSIPVGYSNTASGPATAIIGSTVTGSVATIDADGTLVAANTQKTLGADSSAVAGSSAAGDNNTVTLALGSAAVNSVTASAVLDSNNVGAAFSGNTRTASIGIAADTASFAGTAVIANSQSFDGNTTDVNALNKASLISATVASADGATPGAANVFSNSNLSVDSNQITSAASGNVLTGSISLASALSYNSAGTNTSAASINNVLPTGTEQINATGALTVASRQTNDGGATAFLSATTDDAIITASVQESIGSATTLSENRVTAAATGNTLTSNITSGTGSALFNASATLANSQSNGTSAFEFGVNASATDTALSLTLGDTDNGTVSGSSGTVAGNVIASSAVGSQADQTIALSAASLVTSDGTATLSFDASPAGTAAGLSSSGAATIASVQTNTKAPVTALTTGSSITLTSADDDGVTTATDLAVTGNIQQAFAIGADAGNTLSLSGVSVGASAGVANAQVNDTNSTVTATMTGRDTLNVVESAGSASVVAPSVTLSGNRSEALATGVTAANALSVNATTVDLVSVAATGGAQTLDPSLDADSITASYGVLNTQDVAGNVSATANPLSAVGAFNVTVGDNTVGASVVNDANRLTAQAQAAVAANSIDLNIGTITLSGSTEANNVASVLNQQLVAASVTATARPNGAAALVFTDLGTTDSENVANASVSTSSNRVTAIADGAVATNSLSAGGTSLQVFDGATGGDAGLASVTSAGVLTANAAFTAINRQEFNSTGPVTATLRQTASTPGVVTDSALVLTDISGSATSSGIASNSNMLTALASSLEAANSLTLSGTTLRTTGALVSSQDSDALVNALIGYDGTAGSAGTASSTYSGTGTATGTFTVLTDILNNTGSAQTITFAGPNFTAAQAAYLNGITGLSGAAAGGNTVTIAGGASINTATAFAGFSFNSGTSGAGTGDETITITNFTVPGTPASSGAPNAGGVIIALGANITGSSVSVASNSATGQALGNTASNSVSITATSLDADGASASAPTTAGLLASGDYGADDDYALTSDQTVSSGSASNAVVFATFAIDQAPDKSISNATLAVDGNAQVAEAMANNVTNTLSVSATDMDVTAATSASLANRQGGTANVDASSDMEAFANVQSSGSTISLDGNSNRAIGVINNASNSLTVSGTNIAGTGANATVTTVTNDTRASGSFALNNSQTTLATSDLDTTATTSIYNNDVVDTASTGIVNGSVSMANNLTFAESSANRASNSVTVAGSASNAAPAALANDQSSLATVNATATSSVTTNLTGTDATPDLEAADNSAVSIAGNTTQSLARGNTATNTMVFTAGADFGTATSGANVNTVSGTAGGAAAMLNSQTNNGDIGASSSASYQVVLNGGAGAATAAVLNGAVSVSGNTVAATAFGNQATNRMELAVLNSGNATAAFNNLQSNTGVITATASNVNFTSSVTGTVTNGAFRNVNNAASATAVGNSSITTIIGR